MNYRNLFWVFFSIIVVLVILDVCFSIWRNHRRHETFIQAKQRSKQTKKKLLVIGDPNSGFWNKHIKKAYGCGDVCIDLMGCNECPKSIKSDLLVKLKKMPTNEYVIYESCVLEYVDQRLVNEIKKEIDRVSEGDYYGVRIKPNIFPTMFSFVELG